MTGTYIQLQGNGDEIRRVHAALDEIRAEFWKARKKHKPMHSAHEAYAVILEELDEAWDEIKRDDVPAARKEMVQVAAMALAFLVEIAPAPTQQQPEEEEAR